MCTDLVMYDHIHQTSTLCEAVLGPGWWESVVVGGGEEGARRKRWWTKTKRDRRVAHGSLESAGGDMACASVALINTAAEGEGWKMYYEGPQRMRFFLNGRGRPATWHEFRWTQDLRREFKMRGCEVQREDAFQMDGISQAKTHRPQK